MKKLYTRFKFNSLLKNQLPLGRKNANALVLIEQAKFDHDEIQQAFHHVFDGELKVVFLIFTKEKNKKAEGNIHYCSLADFHLSKQVLSSKVKDIISSKFEFVFEFFSDKHIFLNYISASSKANLRIGTLLGNNKTADLTINDEELTWIQFFEETKKYVYKIKKS